MHMRAVPFLDTTNGRGKEWKEGHLLASTQKKKGADDVLYDRWREERSKYRPNQQRRSGPRSGGEGTIPSPGKKKNISNRCAQRTQVAEKGRVEGEVYVLMVSPKKREGTFVRDCFDQKRGGIAGATGIAGASKEGKWKGGGRSASPKKKRYLIIAFTEGKFYEGKKSGGNTLVP